MTSVWVREAQEKLNAHWKLFHQQVGNVPDWWFRQRDELQRKLREVLNGEHFYVISESLGEQYDALGEAMKEAIGVLLKSHNELMSHREELQMWLDEAPTP